MDGLPRGAKVLVAMSGGVDSSVAAAMLVRAGCEVVGCFMRLGTPGEPAEGMVRWDAKAEACAANRERRQGCCSVNDAADARLVAAELGIPFYVCNFAREFGRVIDYFVDEYANGRTPNPCVRCNDWLKFGRLHEYARRIGASFIASGHYARVERGAGADRWGHDGPRLLRGVDRGKDQSYVLFGSPRERLGEMLLPVGGMPKREVRALAERFGLPVFDKPDSQEICFVPDGDYAALVESRRPGAAAMGRIVDTDGNEVGAHAGQHRYTIGQRRGVGVALGRPIYVIGRDAETNTVVVGSRERLLANGCQAGQVNWLTEREPFDDWRPCLARCRYNTEPVAARCRLSSERLEVRFDEPLAAVAPGQAVVVYDAEEPDWVLGGGWIDRGVFGG